MNNELLRVVNDFFDRWVDNYKRKLADFSEEFSIDDKENPAECEDNRE